MQALPASNSAAGVAPSRDLLAGIRQQMRTIVLVTAVVTGVAVGLSLLQTPKYTATASVILQDSGDTGSTPNMATEKQVASSDTIANSVLQTLRLDASPDELSSGLSVSVPVDTNVLVFSYMSPVPDQAQRRAQAFADAYLAYRHQALLRASQAANDLIDVRIAELRNELQSVTAKREAAKSHARREALRLEANALFAQIGVQEQRAASQVGSLAAAGDRLVTATLPTVPSSPRVAVNALLGIFFGLSLGTAIALWRASVKRRFQTRDDVEQGLRTPLLEVIPHRRGRVSASSTMTIGAPTATTNAYRELVAKILTLPVPSSNGSHPPGHSIERLDGMTRTIAVVALGEDAGLSEVAANVGAVIALSGRSVLVVSTAAEDDGWDGLLAPHAGPGVTDVMRGHAELSDALRPTAIEGLRVIPRGTEDESWTLLDTEGVRRTFGQMSALANVVLVHVPARPGTGATAIVAACDAVLYAGALRSTSIADAERVRSELEALGKPTLGAVMFDRPAPRPPQRKAADRKPADRKPADRKAARRLAKRNRRAVPGRRMPGEPPKWKALRHIVRSRISEHPRLYLPLARIRYPGPSPKVVGRETDLVIDGYTRSACTFAVYAFQLAQQISRLPSKRSASRQHGEPSGQRQVRVAHHLHAPAQLLEAARRGLPTLVVIREPEGAILSQVLQEPHVSLRDALVSYERFYSVLLPHADSFVAGEFDEVTKDFGSVIRRLNKRFGTHYRTFNATEENIGQCFDLIRERPTTDPAWRKQVLGFESGTVSLQELLASWPKGRRDAGPSTEAWIPSDERRKSKEALRERWNAPELAVLRERATATYHAFLRATDEDETT